MSQVKDWEEPTGVGPDPEANTTTSWSVVDGLPLP